MRYFELSEFDCSHSGNNLMTDEFLHKIDLLRDLCGFPFNITSGYRDPEHPVEARKETPGTHTRGIAADILCTDAKMRGAIVEKAIGLGFKGIGVAKTFVHVDLRDSEDLVIWTYS